MLQKCLHTGICNLVIRIFHALLLPPPSFAWFTRIMWRLHDDSWVSNSRTDSNKQFKFSKKLIGIRTLPFSPFKRHKRCHYSTLQSTFWCTNIDCATATTTTTILKYVNTTSLSCFLSNVFDSHAQSGWAVTVILLQTDVFWWWVFLLSSTSIYSFL